LPGARLWAGAALKALQTLARMLGVPQHQAEDALHSERAARAVISRRNLFAAGAAMVGASAFSFAAPVKGFYVWNSVLVEVGGSGLPAGAIGRCLGPTGDFIRKGVFRW
jgi:hypothetical protein